MKKHLKRFVRYTLSFEISTWVIPGLKYQGGIKTLLWTGLVLTLLYKFLRPIIKIIFLPLNLLTLGFFKWVIQAVLFWVMTLIVAEVTISGFKFPGWSYQGFSIPAFVLPKVAVFFLSSVCLYLIYKTFIWLNR